MCPGRDNWRGTGQLPDERALEEELEESQVADPEETEHSSTEPQVPVTSSLTPAFLLLLEERTQMESSSSGRPAAGGHQSVEPSDGLGKGETGFNGEPITRHSSWGKEVGEGGRWDV